MTGLLQMTDVLHIHIQQNTLQYSFRFFHVRVNRFLFPALELLNKTGARRVSPLLEEPAGLRLPLAGDFVRLQLVYQRDNVTRRRHLESTRKRKSINV